LGDLIFLEKKNSLTNLGFNWVFYPQLNQLSKNNTKDKHHEGVNERASFFD
jgi:mannose/fructose/N-acetylgalactosamine-specific phosphotransferase system component IID